MANHVYTSVNFENINQEAKAKLLELYSRIREDNDYEWFSDIMVDGSQDSPTHEMTNNLSWNIDNVGSKWCYFDDKDESSFRTTSAWSWPEEGVDWVISELTKIQPDLVTIVRYEDEMPNFYGACVYESNELVESFEESWDDIIDTLTETVEGLAEMWDEEEEDWTEEGRDLIMDNLYETIYSKQDDVITEALSYVGEDE